MRQQIAAAPLARALGDCQIRKNRHALAGFSASAISA